jgi:ketosteroid isomerase-like protein
MKRFPTSCALLLLLSACAPALRQGASGEAEVLSVERRRFQAMVDNDLNSLAALLHDDLTYTHSSGRTESKTQFLESLRSGQLRYLAIEPGNVSVRSYGEVALVRGSSRMRVRSPAGEQAFTVRFLEVYQWDDGAWRLTAWQSTRVPE